MWVQRIESRWVACKANIPNPSTIALAASYNFLVAFNIPIITGYFEVMADMFFFCYY